MLADRGFKVADLVAAKEASLNIPPFLEGRKRLTAQEEIETKKIAKERIYRVTQTPRSKRNLLILLIKWNKKLLIKIWCIVFDQLYCTSVIHFLNRGL